MKERKNIYAATRNFCASYSIFLGIKTPNVWEEEVMPWHAAQPVRHNVGDVRYYGRAGEPRAQHRGIISRRLFDLGAQL